jgi:hypothetical protein
VRNTLTLQRAFSRAAFALATMVLACPFLISQQTTNTNCSTFGNNTNCTSTTTDYGAQQQRAYEQGQQFGNALGKGLSAAMQAHAYSSGLKKFCAAHPGQEWHYYSRADGHVLSSGHCPSDEDIAVEAANKFRARHKEFISEQSNAQFMTDYLESHRLDPRNEKSYETAYKDLKKAGKLELYSK